MKIYTLVEDYSDYESPFLAQHGVSFLIEKTGKESSSTSSARCKIDGDRGDKSNHWKLSPD